MTDTMPDPAALEAALAYVSTLRYGPIDVTVLADAAEVLASAVRHLTRVCDNNAVFIDRHVARADKAEAEVTALKEQVFHLTGHVECYAEIADLRSDRDRLRGLVEPAYNEGYRDGMIEQAKSAANLPFKLFVQKWAESDTRKALEARDE